MYFVDVLTLVFKFRRFIFVMTVCPIIDEAQSSKFFFSTLHTQLCWLVTGQLVGPSVHKFGELHTRSHNCKGLGLFSCRHATVKEALSIHWSVGPSVCWSVGPLVH